MLYSIKIDHRKTWFICKLGAIITKTELINKTFIK